MKCKDVKIEVIQGNPFAKDKLNRESLADNLTCIANLYADTGAVIAIDGDWGAGKTTFVNMWNKKLSENEYKTIYFNAWQADFQNDPFIALMSELKEVFKQTSTFKKVIASSAKIGLKFIGEVVKEFLCNNIVAFNKKTIEIVTDEFVKQYYEHISDCQKQKENLNDFKRHLSEFIASESNGKPVFFFIDELDRCNPHYAVKLLERIKHLFDVPNIIFVLAVNLNQLQHAVQGFYGSSMIDGKEYLRRFIDIEYTLPAPDMEAYCNFLYEEYDLKTFFEHDSRSKDEDLQNEKVVFNYIAKDLIVASHVNLRTANKIFAYTRLALCSYNTAQNFPADLFFLLCFWKVTNPTFYNQIKSREYSIQNLLIEIEKELPKELFTSDNPFPMRHISYAIATLLIQYNYYDGTIREQTFKGISHDVNSKPEFPIRSNKIHPTLLNEALNDESKKSYNMYGLQSIIDKIDLVDSLKITGVN